MALLNVYHVLYLVSLPLLLGQHPPNGDPTMEQVLHQDPTTTEAMPLEITTGRCVEPDCEPPKAPEEATTNVPLDTTENPAFEPAKDVFKQKLLDTLRSQNSTIVQEADSSLDEVSNEIHIQKSSVVSKKGVEPTDNQSVVAKKGVDALDKKPVVPKKGVDSLDKKPVVPKKGVEDSEKNPVVGKKGVDLAHEKSVVPKKGVESGNRPSVVPKKGVDTDEESQIVPKKEAIPTQDTPIVAKKGVEDLSRGSWARKPEIVIVPLEDRNPLTIPKQVGNTPEVEVPQPKTLCPDDPEVTQTPHPDPTPSTSLVLGVLFGVILCSVVGFLGYKRFDAIRRRREYRRMNDFLIDGMYNDL